MPEENKSSTSISSPGENAPANGRKNSPARGEPGGAPDGKRRDVPTNGQARPLKKAQRLSGAPWPWEADMARGPVSANDDRVEADNIGFLSLEPKKHEDAAAPAAGRRLRNSWARPHGPGDGSSVPRPGAVHLEYEVLENTDIEDGAKAKNAADAVAAAMEDAADDGVDDGVVDALPRKPHPVDAPGKDISKETSEDTCKAASKAVRDQAQTKTAVDGPEDGARDDRKGDHKQDRSDVPAAEPTDAPTDALIDALMDAPQTAPKDAPGEVDGEAPAGDKAVAGDDPQTDNAGDGTGDGKAASRGQKKPGRGIHGKAVFGLKLFAVVFLSLLVLLLSSALVVQLNVERFTSFALEEISRKTGIRIEFSGATMRLFPVPAIGVTHVRVVVPNERLKKNLPEAGQADIDFRAGAVYFAPSVLALLNGEFEPEMIVLDAPALVGTLPVAFDDLLSAPGGGQADDADRRLEDILPFHCVASVQNGGISLRDVEGAYLRVDNCSLNLSITNLPLKNPLNGIRGAFSADRATFQSRDFAAQGADLNLSGKTTLTAPLLDLTCEVEGRLAISPLNFAAATHLKLHGDRTTLLAGGGRIKGFFVFDGVEIPYDIVANASLPMGAGKHLALAPAERAKEPMTHLKVSKFGIGEDVLAIDALVFPDPKNPGAAGRLAIEKVSLTRWLTFARNLSPGLQISLDRITDGHIDFYIDTNHLVAPDILATAAEATFTGKGGIASWKDIVVYLEMESDFVDLGVGIAESVGVKATPPNYGHRPLTEMRTADIFPERETAPENAAQDAAQVKADDTAPTEGEQQAEDARTPAKTADSGQGAAPLSAGADAQQASSLSYDIRLMSHKIHYGYIDLTEGGVVIHPGRNKKGVPSAQIDMYSRLHGGTIAGYGHFTDEDLDKKSEYEFHIEGKDVDLAALHKQLSFVPIVQGTGGCVVDVTSEGSEIDDFLANLKGRVRTTTSRTRLLDDRFFSPLRADVVLDIRNAAFRNSALGLNGTWQVACEGNAGWHANFRLPGQIWFGGEEGKAGVRFANLAINLEAKKVERLFKALGSQDVDARISGRATLDTSTKSVRAENAEIALPGIEARGTVAFAMMGSTPTVTGSLSEARLDVPRASRVVTGKAADIPREFHQVSLTGTEFSARSDFVGLSRFKAQADGIPLSGSLSCDFSKSVPSLAMNVRLGSLDLDARYPEKKKEGGQNGKGARSEPGKPLDYSFMKKVNAEGTLHLERLKVKKTTLVGVQAPFSLKNGHLSLPGVRGKICGGPFTASGTCDFSSGLAFKLDTRVDSFDLGELMRDRGSKDTFTGKVNFTGKISSAMQREGELAKNLNGNVAFKSGKGSFQATPEKGTEKESPILFNEAGCTAEITNGVLRTKDFHLTGDTLRLTGEGWIDLVKEELDLQLVADMNNLPNIPLRLHGSFDNPKRDISGGMVILNAIGGFARGIFNVVGSVFSGIFGIFR